MLHAGSRTENNMAEASKPVPAFLPTSLIIGLSVRVWKTHQIRQHQIRAMVPAANPALHPRAQRSCLLNPGSCNIASHPLGLQKCTGENTKLLYMLGRT